MLILCSEPVFLYKEQVYKQIDGVAMGSPLAPLLANWFVSKIEQNILSDKSHQKYKPTLYKRYVDDIFAIFKSNEDRDMFFETLNTAHPNLSFTMERSTNMLPFLDISISIENNAFATKVYRKPSNTSIVMNYNCVAPTKWKTSLVKCMLNRAYKISSSYDFFTAEIDHIESILMRNDYPVGFVQNIVKDFVDFHKITNDNFKFNIKNHETTTNPDVTEVNTKAFVTIPYIGKSSIELQKSIRREMKIYGIDITAAYRTAKVGNYFSLKSKCSELFTSNVIYKFTCSQDEKISYIGETRRQLFKRAAEHIKSDKNSAVFDHLYQCTGCQNVANILNCFKILKVCNSFNILTFEAMMISRFKPILNIQLGPGKGTLTSLAIY